MTMQTACAAHWCRLRAARQKDVRLAVLARFQPDLLCRHTPRVVKTALSAQRIQSQSCTETHTQPRIALLTSETLILSP